MILSSTGILKRLKSQQNQQENASNNHEIPEVSWILPKFIGCDILPALLPTDSACSPIVTLQSPTPSTRLLWELQLAFTNSQQGKLCLLALSHQTEARCWGSGKLAMQRTTWIQPEKVSNDFEKQKWRNKQLTSFWLALLSVRQILHTAQKADLEQAYPISNKMKALSSLNKTNGFRRDPDGWWVRGDDHPAVMPAH